MKDAQQQIIEEQNRRILQLLIECERWKAKAEEKIALRREIESVLGIQTGDTNDEALMKGVKALRQMVRLDKALSAYECGDFALPEHLDKLQYNGEGGVP